MTRLLKVVAITMMLIGTASSMGPSAISNFYKKNPFKGAFLTCSIKGCTADLVAQYIAASKANDQHDEHFKRQLDYDNALSRLNPLKKARGGDMHDTAIANKKKFKIDLRRSAMFLIYGGLYQGCANEFLYNSVLPRLGTGTDWRTVGKKVAADAFGIVPFLCIPMAYLVKGLLLGRSVRDSYSNYWSDVVNKGVLFKNWMIFIPVQCLTFSVIPEHFRVSFVACVSFFWMIILSCILSSS
mmetsp:Transcript_6213/g.13520  ORF Transcript_6213/g.13520 Transcript_6213/m.13520 type:complete len:241 (+) Transcript_6213:131-853(+)